VPENGERRCPCTFRVTEQSGEVNTKDSPPRPAKTGQASARPAARPLTGILTLPSYQGPSTVIVSELLSSPDSDDYVSFLHRSDTGLREVAMLDYKTDYR
jgi:hypothetical protein